MSEYLDEEEQIARLKSWWSENGTSIIVSVVIAVVVVAFSPFLCSWDQLVVIDRRGI